jgi:hypothetical protein
MLNPSKTDEMTMSSEPFDSKDLARKISAAIRCLAGVVSFCTSFAESLIHLASA